MKINGLSDLNRELSKVAPTRYSHFNKKQDLPFIVFLDDGEDNFHADNLDFLTGEFVRVELYTLTKDTNLENRLKDIFRESGIGFDKMPTEYIDEENMFLSTFSIKLTY